MTRDATTRMREDISAAHEITRSHDMPSTALDVREPTVDAQILTPMGMIDKALASNASVEMIDRLMSLQERYDAAQAKKAFIAARSDAKSEISETPIVKNRTGHNNKKYADFQAYAQVIDPILSKHGLSYGFETEQDGAQVRVTCVLSHRDGHETRNTLVAAADNTGNKNPVQAIGSTTTYLSRYTLMAALGLAATDDDDARAAGAGAAVSPAQLKQLQALASEVGADVPRFCAMLKIDALPNLPASQFDRAMAALNLKKGAQP